ncbi:MAG: ectoine/hydroxyectoine ABC transporter ATP-binding protein EhuA [Castellaniella sp.]|uniref:ectoine/hydroxyectoine ABC transporter ATP-binding protein EhuA n=1 Tax=Castellaniella sp. TaxID=1955812 RepID=UPI002A35B543|nr:ectoine/hydroxyectoine ABC transporter ATP-binding protein EhuA [Castellaniella sp.]MDY0309676.1 ectoine/hydroxyectoine ABC transporter ATP-binding protein EhuA [Castellaniella sp.]
MPDSSIPPDPTDAIITMDQVVKRFGAATVLDHLDFRVSKGEKVTIIGPSGSGKSTVLRILMTLETLDEGLIHVAGKPLWHEYRHGRPVPASEAHLRAMRKEMGMVFQQFNLFPHMTVRRNVTESPVHVLGLSKAEADQRAYEYLDLVGMTDHADKFPSQLSGGQQQRVAIARALAMRPNILLFDEPTSALDPELVGEVLTVIRRLSEEHDLTMLLVTHEMEFARQISDRVCFFDKGTIVEQAPPEAIFTAPQEARTREFLKTFIQARQNA